MKINKIQTNFQRDFLAWHSENRHNYYMCFNWYIISVLELSRSSGCLKFRGIQ